MPFVLFRRNRQPQELLNAPIDLRVVQVTTNSVTLAWTPTTTTHTEFVVQVEDELSGFVDSRFTPDTTVVIPNLSYDNGFAGVYRFQVMAIRGNERSDPSNIITIRLLRFDPVPPIPPILAGNAHRQLQLAAYTRQGEMVADFSPDLVSASISKNEHGELALEASVRMHERLSRRYTQPLPIATVALNDGANTIWTGRAETLTPSPTTLDINAAGLWDALNDLRYTAEWSRIDLDGWREVRPGEITPFGVDTTANQDYEINIGAQASFEDGSSFGPSILIALKPDTNYFPSQIGRVVVLQPHRSRTRYQRIDASFTATLSAAIEVRLRFMSFDLQTTYDTVTVITGQGNGDAPLENIQRGTITLQTPPCDAIVIDVAPFAAGSYTPSTDAEYVRFELIRVRATTEAVTPNLIAADILSMFTALPYPPLLSRTLYLQSSARDLLNESYSDASPLDVLIYLAQTADYLLRQWQARIVAGYLKLEPVQTGRVWYLDEGEITQERPTSGIANRVYAQYNDNNGRTLRTLPINDLSSQSRYEIIREDTINVDTTDAAQAEQQAQVRLRDNARSLVRVKIGPITTIYDSNNAASPLWLVEPNDRIVPRFLPIYDTSDPLYEIGIARVEYDLVENTLTVETLLAPPELERILALQALATYPEPNRT